MRIWIQLVNANEQMHAKAQMYTRKYSVEYFGRAVDRVHQRMHNGAEIQIEKGGGWGRADR